MPTYKVFYVADGENLSITTFAKNEMKAIKNAEKYFAKLKYKQAEIEFVRCIDKM